MLEQVFEEKGVRDVHVDEKAREWYWKAHEEVVARNRK